MKWYSAVSENIVLKDAFKECTSSMQQEVCDSIDLVIVFVGSDFSESYDDGGSLRRFRTGNGFEIFN